MQVLNSDKKTRTVTLSQEELLNIAVLMRKGAYLWREEKGQDVSKDLELANMFSSLHGELLRYELQEEGKL